MCLIIIRANSTRFVTIWSLVQIAQQALHLMVCRVLYIYILHVQLESRIHAFRSCDYLEVTHLFFFACFLSAICSDCLFTFSLKININSQQSIKHYADYLTFPRFVFFKCRLFRLADVIADEFPFKYCHMNTSTFCTETCGSTETNKLVFDTVTHGEKPFNFARRW